MIQTARVPAGPDILLAELWPVPVPELLKSL